MASFSIEVARHAGTCYGVQRALDLAVRAGREANALNPVHTLGPLIHNPIVVDELEREHVSMAESLDDIACGTVVIRAHGVVPEIIDQAKGKALRIVDATCPYVKKVHIAAEKLASDGYRVIVVGEHGHPEVEGILGHAGSDAVVIENVDQARSSDISGKIGVVVQTTQTAENLAEVIAELSHRCTELRLINTICRATSERQEAAAELAGRVDAMIIVGGRNSGNTRRLAQICKDRCARSHHVESASELVPDWFRGVSSVGITAGASTPQTHIDAVVSTLRGMDI